MTRFTTNKLGTFTVVFDEQEKEDVFASELTQVAESVANELNSGVELYDVLSKYITDEPT